MTTPGRFSTIVSDQTRSPQGVSTDESAVLAVWAVVQFLVLAVLFQAANASNWAGMLTYLTLTLFLLAQIALTVHLTRARRVHPRGFTLRARIAGGWAVLVTVIAGWFWIAQGAHSSPVWLTTAVAAVAALPALVVATLLGRASR